ncbi:hypothetical protein D3C72_1968080 [compost metagenome]
MADIATIGCFANDEIGVIGDRLGAAVVSSAEIAQPLQAIDRTKVLVEGLVVATSHAAIAH